MPSFHYSVNFFNHAHVVIFRGGKIFHLYFYAVLDDSRAFQEVFLGAKQINMSDRWYSGVYDYYMGIHYCTRA